MNKMYKEKVILTSTSILLSQIICIIITYNTRSKVQHELLEVSQLISGPAMRMHYCYYIVVSVSHTFAQDIPTYVLVDVHTVSVQFLQTP